MRISSIAAVLSLAGCSAPPVIKDKVSQARAEDRIDCALGGVQAFEKRCAIERGDGATLTLRHEGGGFRRLTLESDGTIDTADGADGITAQTMSDGRTELSVGQDRYRLPAAL